MSNALLKSIKIPIVCSFSLNSVIFDLLAESLRGLQNVQLGSQTAFHIDSCFLRGTYKVYRTLFSPIV